VAAKPSAVDAYIHPAAAEPRLRKLTRTP
jgi:hypothetical protein